MSSSDLVKFLQKRAGDYFRGAVRYDQDSTDILYLRKDLQEDRIQSEFDRIIERVQPEATRAEKRAFPFGDLYVTVRRFEEATLLHFPSGKHQGTLVALEPDATQDLNKFTTECLTRIEY